MASYLDSAVYVVSGTCSTDFDRLTLSTEKHRCANYSWADLTLAIIFVVATVDSKDKTAKTDEIGQETKIQNDRVSSNNLDRLFVG